MTRFRKGIIRQIKKYKFQHSTKKTAILKKSMERGRSFKYAMNRAKRTTKNVEVNSQGR